MKKLFKLLLSITVSLSFFSCSDNDDPNPIIDPVIDEANGAYILNRGSYYNGIDGSVNYVNLETGLNTPDIFMSVNGRSLGAGPNSMAVWGDFLYILVYESNTMEIVDRNTMMLVKQIKFDGTGGIEGSGPRHIAMSDTKAYITMFDGDVISFDCLTLKCELSLAVGDNPEGIAIVDDYIYVAISGGMNYMLNKPYDNKMVKIDKRNFTVEKKFEVGLNPTDVVTNGTDLFVLCMGNYEDVDAAVYKVSGDTSFKFAPATLIAIDNNYLYAINAPWSSTEPVSYLKYPVNNSSNPTSFVAAGEEVDSPNAIAVEPVSGNVFVASVRLENGWPSYTTDGYYCIYSPDGQKLDEGETGIDPYAIVFNYKN